MILIVKNIHLFISPCVLTAQATRPAGLEIHTLYGSDRVTDSHHVYCHVFVSSHINFSDLCNGLPEMFSVLMLIS